MRGPIRGPNSGQDLALFRPVLTRWRATSFRACWSYGSQICDDYRAGPRRCSRLMVGTHSACPAGFFGGKIDTVPFFPRQSRARLPVDPALFYLLVTRGSFGDADPLHHGRGVLPVPVILLLHAVLHPLQPAGPAFVAILIWADGRRSAAGSIPAWSSTPIRSTVLSIHAPTSYQHLRGLVLCVGARRLPHRARALVMDIKTRDYVAAAQTRGESSVVHSFCGKCCPMQRGSAHRQMSALRIGTTTSCSARSAMVGLGLAPPKARLWPAIKDSSRLLRAYIHPVLPRWWGVCPLGVPVLNLDSPTRLREQLAEGLMP